jgi:hypothetical protein
MALGIKSINYIYLGFLKACINKYTNKISKNPFYSCKQLGDGLLAEKCC